MTDAVMTLATVPAVLAAVNLLKNFGVKGRWALLAAVLIGILFQEWDYLQYAIFQPTFDPRQLVIFAGKGLLLGLGAAGLYDLAPARDTPTTDSLAATSDTPHSGKHKA
ncbi:MAG: hypothetical protein PUK59_04510 [Actinomycetaceae bacterium]|nr:hypothetical protein [Actinomycetaceae bacterium]MDY5273665.1 hypothetical protein [Arcanobacterium sp.]